MYMIYELLFNERVHKPTPPQNREAAEGFAHLLRTIYLSIHFYRAPFLLLWANFFFFFYFTIWKYVKGALPGLMYS